MNSFSNYYTTLLMLALSGTLLFVQVLVADLIALRGGQKPGYPIPADARTFLFRAARAHLNTSESISSFALLGIVGVLVGANAEWLNGLSVLWFVSRLAHMGFYYANMRSARSLAFAVSLAALLGLAVTTLRAF